MRRSHPASLFARALALLALALPLAGCLENRVTVDLFTQISADGSCTRRVRYQVERVDTGKGDARVALPPEKDPLRQFVFPSGEPWRVQDETELGLHVVTVEATLPSPADFERDFRRLRTKNAPPAENSVSAFADPESGRYEFQELLTDPASPLAGARLLARLVQKADDDFARRFLAALDDPGSAPRDRDVRRLFRERFAAPFAREIDALARRPFYGPRERRELEAALDALDQRQAQLAAGLVALTPGVAPEKLTGDANTALNDVGERLLGRLEAAGLPLLSLDGSDEIHFHATLVMPGLIVRANTCANGDTAEWDFEQADLFGRGFEMKALAAAP